jgi:hypothetical protein
MRYRLFAVALLFAASNLLCEDSPDSAAIMELREKIEGSRWAEVGSAETADGGWLFSIDPSRYERTNSGYVVWLRSDRKPNGHVERFGSYDRFVQHLEIDCKQHRQRVMRAIFYAGTRTLNIKEEQQVGPGKWTELIPDTMGEATADAVCKALADLES